MKYRIHYMINNVTVEYESNYTKFAMKHALDFVKKGIKVSNFTISTI